ncbi:hypothetical protein MLD38_003558 [Melastoma candidum]|uniref:Uncharacterized protein n=1 Tax=Melastoma candidum TaxID=119954 RepID=A0ACB9S2F6_9MYRT|nr:hypothetical protein MLD38_003558 [Melastoma candidum]
MRCNKTAAAFSLFIDEPLQISSTRTGTALATPIAVLPSELLASIANTAKASSTIQLTAQFRELEMVMSVLRDDPSLIGVTTPHDRQSFASCRCGQRPDRVRLSLCLRVMHGRTSCVEKRLGAGTNVRVFDSLHGRTCLHYTAYYGHSECLKAILSSARSSRVATSWFVLSNPLAEYFESPHILKIRTGCLFRGSRFVNIRDGKGATSLHLAAHQRRPDSLQGFSHGELLRNWCFLSKGTREALLSILRPGEGISIAYASYWHGVQTG